MRYRGITFLIGNEPKEFAFCIPFVDANGRQNITSPIMAVGWNLDVTVNDLLIGEFLLSDGTMPISMEEYNRRISDKTDEDCSLFVRAVKVAGVNIGENIYDMLKEDTEMFVLACHIKLEEAIKNGFFDQRRILPQWKKLGFDRKAVGEVVDLSKKRIAC